MRFKLAAPLLLLSLLIAACGGDKASDSNNRTQREEPRQGQELVSAQALLHQSADALQDVESYSFDFRMGIGADGFSMNFDGTGQYQAPDQMYMHMDLGFLGETEMIMRGTDVYMKLQGQWTHMDLTEASGVSAEQFRQLFEKRGMIDYAELARQGVDVRDAGIEAIDGVDYRHLEMTIDGAAMQNLIGEAGLDDPAIADALDEIFDGATADVWVDDETSFPRRASFAFSFDVPQAGTMDMNMEMNFTRLNEPVTIPEPPADADTVPFPET